MKLNGVLFTRIFYRTMNAVCCQSIKSLYQLNEIRNELIMILRYHLKNEFRIIIIIIKKNEGRKRSSEKSAFSASPHHQTEKKWFNFETLP